MTAQRALEALRILGRSYRPDTRQQTGLWAAQCPACGFYCAGEDRPLTIREAREGGPVTIWCTRGCPRETIEVLLRGALEPESLEQRVRRLELKLQLLQTGRAA